MTFRSGRLLFVASLAFAAAGCVGEDSAPGPRFVSNSDGSGLSTLGRSPVLRESGDTGTTAGGYFIEFRSRYALSYGHTYAVFGRANAAGQMINPEVAGLHPSSYEALPYVLGHFVPVPAETGESDGDLEDEYRSASWRVMLNAAEYDQVVGYIRKLQAHSHLWQASVYNCNAFTGDIAHYMGYKVPSKYLRPQQFITQLRELNVGRRAFGD
jgi:hypothetical protein